MNNVNFINPLPPKKQAALQRWYYQTLYSLACVILILTSISLYQWWEIKKTKFMHSFSFKNNEKSTLEIGLKQIKEKEALLAKRIEKLNRLQQTLKKPSLFLDKLSEYIPVDIALLQCKHQKKSFELEGQGFSISTITTFVEKLNKDLFFKNVRIFSMAQENAESNQKRLIRFIIKGNI